MDIIGGYRLVRSLGSGTRSEVYLGYPTARSDHPPVAVKRYLPTTTDDDIAREISALSRTSSPHLLRLDDVALDESGRTALILPLLTPASLGRVLMRRERLEPGEIVTAAAPIVAAVAALHHDAVSHGRIGTGAILFDRFGAPVLGSFGHTAPIPTAPNAHTASEAARALDPRAQRDLTALESMVRGLLALVPGPRVSVLEWLDRSPAGGDEPSDWLGELGARLFDLAESTPIEIPPLDALPRSDIPVRIVMPPAATRWPQPSMPPAPSPTDRVPISTVDQRAPRRAPTSWGRHRVTRGTHRRARFTRAPAMGHSVRERSVREGSAREGSARWRTFSRDGRIPARLRVVAARKSVWLAIVTGAVLVLGALLVVPAGNAQSEEGPLPPRTGTADAADAAAATTRDSGSAQTWGASEENAVRSDDPVTAASALLTLRQICLASVDPGDCVGAREQSGSALSDAHPRRPADYPAGSAPPALVDRWGDFALFSFSTAGVETPPASLLIVRGEDGWRIRNIGVAVARG